MARSATFMQAVFCGLTVCATGCGRKRPETRSSAPPAEEGHPVSGKWYAESRKLYHGIPVSVRFAPADEELAARAWAYLERVDDVFNDYRDDSEVGRLNNAAGHGRVQVSDDLAKALRLSRELHETTGGAFDITVGPLRRLWKGAAKTGKLPSPSEIAAARSACGLDKVKLNGNVLSVDSPGVKFDFGGVVKGMAVDEVIAMLKAGGARAALVQVGGETSAFGVSMRGKPHVIGVQHPAELNRMWTAVVDPGTGVSCSTSGNYQQPVVIGGRAFYHIFDPRTGRPVDTRTLSVSVVFPETGKNGLADGLSTAGAVIGAEKALSPIEELGGQALFVVEAGGDIREFKTRGWDALVRKD